MEYQRGDRSEQDRRIEELSRWVLRLAGALSTWSPRNEYIYKAFDYLDRENLIKPHERILIAAVMKRIADGGRD